MTTDSVTLRDDDSSPTDPIRELRRRARKADTLEQQIDLDRQASMLEQQRLRMKARLNRPQAQSHFPGEALSR